MLVSQIIKDKGDAVFTVGPHETVATAAAHLRERRIGALVVRQADGTVAGILSERDIVWGLAQHGAAALEQSVESCMTRDVIVAQPNETVDELMGRKTDT